MPKETKNPNLYQFALLIWDLFRGEKTDEKTSLLRENKIVYEYVPNKMTTDFQILKWDDGRSSGHKNVCRFILNRYK